MSEMFTVDSTMAEVMMCPAFSKIQKYLIYSPAKNKQSNENNDSANAPLSALSAMGWSPKGIADGLNCLYDTIESGRMEQLFIYSDEECAGEDSKKDVNFIWLQPENPDPEKPIVILCAGGAYIGVCTLVESLPTARHFLEKGYQVFVFTYRVSIPEAAIQALADLAAGIRYLTSHEEKLGINASHYVVCGHSAGANLISNWGASNTGYRQFGLSKPLALLPVYTYIDLEEASKQDENGGLVAPMFGENWRDYIRRFNVVDHIDADYPPCYIVCGKDDETVPCRNSQIMKEKLDNLGVAAILEAGEHAPHGFGDGTGTDVEGWPERAMAFIEELMH